jgi:hypothetical protein
LNKATLQKRLQIYLFVLLVILFQFQKKILSKYTFREKIILQYSSNNLADYELPTLQLVYEYSKINPNHNILYLHTKNVGKEINP